MKNIINTFFITLVLVILGAGAFKLILGNMHSKIESKARLGKLNVSINYTKTDFSDRKILGYAVPYDIVWRTGFNDVTEITFTEDCLFGKSGVKAGTYSLWTIPHKNHWTVILNRETGQYGTQYNSKQDYLRINSEIKKTNFATKELVIKVRQEEKNTLVLNLKIEDVELKIPIME